MVSESIVLITWLFLSKINNFTYFVMLSLCLTQSTFFSLCKFKEVWRDFLTYWKVFFFLKWIFHRLLLPLCLFVYWRQRGSTLKKNTEQEHGNAGSIPSEDKGKLTNKKQQQVADNNSNHKSLTFTLSSSFIHALMLSKHLVPDDWMNVVHEHVCKLILTFLTLI